MAGKEHRYRIDVTWTGNTGEGTASYRSYSRNYDLAAPGKPGIAGSADPAFRGDADRWNPEEMFVASVAACHKLSYLHLCAVGGVVVVDYVDAAEGVMAEAPDRSSGKMTSVTLRPRITITSAADITKAKELHHKAHEICFIANSITTPVAVEPEIVVCDAAPG